MRIINNQSKQTKTATVAQVSFSDSSDFGAVASAEYRGVPIFAPRGISYRPAEGDNLLILPVDGTDACVGVLSNADSLERGELKLCNSAGAYIHLKKNGEIVLNGLVIGKNGQITPKS